MRKIAVIILFFGQFCCASDVKRTSETSEISVAGPLPKCNDILVEIGKERVRVHRSCTDMQNKRIRYVLSPSAERLLISKKMQPATFKRCTGWALQQVAHKELITIVEILATYKIPQEAIDAVFVLVLYGHAINQQGDLIKAYSALNVCWSMLEGLGIEIHYVEEVCVASQILVNYSAVDVYRGIKRTLQHIKRFLAQHIKVRGLNVMDNDEQEINTVEIDLEILDILKDVFPHIKKHPIKTIDNIQDALIPIVIQVATHWIRYVFKLRRDIDGQRFEITTK